MRGLNSTPINNLGVTAASGGRIRAQITSAKAGLTRPTGWHTHICEGQIVYMLIGAQVRCRSAR